MIQKFSEKLIRAIAVRQIQILCMQLIIIIRINKNILLNKEYYKINKIIL